MQLGFRHAVPTVRGGAWLVVGTAHGIGVLRLVLVGVLCRLHGCGLDVACRGRVLGEGRGGGRVLGAGDVGVGVHEGLLRGAGRGGGVEVALVAASLAGIGAAAGVRVGVLHCWVYFLGWCADCAERWAAGGLVDVHAVFFVGLLHFEHCALCVLVSVACLAALVGSVEGYEFLLADEPALEPLFPACKEREAECENEKERSNDGQKENHGGDCRLVDQVFLAKGEAVSGTCWMLCETCEPWSCTLCVALVLSGRAVEQNESDGEEDDINQHGSD